MPLHCKWHFSFGEPEPVVLMHFIYRSSIPAPILNAEREWRVLCRCVRSGSDDLQQFDFVMKGIGGAVDHRKMAVTAIIADAEVGYIYSDLCLV